MVSFLDRVGLGNLRDSSATVHGTNDDKERSTHPGDVDLVDMNYEVHDKKVDLDRDDAWKIGPGQ